MEDQNKETTLIEKKGTEKTKNAMMRTKYSCKLQSSYKETETQSKAKQNKTKQKTKTKQNQTEKIQIFTNLSSIK